MIYICKITKIYMKEIESSVMKEIKTEDGNLIIKFNVEFPAVLSTEQIDKLSEIL